MSRRSGSGLARVLVMGWLVAGAVGLARPLGAAEGLYLNWRGCAGDQGAASDLAGACAGDDGAQALYCAFTLPQAVDSVVALEIVVDLQVMDTTLPPWWQLDPAGCRADALTVDSDLTGSVCSTPWHGLVQRPPVLLAGFFIGEPRGRASQARIKITVAALPDSFRRLNAGEMYVAARLVLSNQETTACAGCQVPTCLVLNSILIGRRQDAIGGNLLLETPGAGSANRATWQGSGADCLAVPVRRRTWGELKVLYR